jgi:TetR/AcrR family transcriptional repressor of nem operon
MPRVSREQARKNRIAIQEASARLFRERGIQPVSVVDVMGAVGLTAGGFYGHFASKDELTAIACDLAFQESANRWRKRAQGKGSKREALDAIVNGYLTRRNRDDPGDACPSATLASDVARESSDAPVRGAYLKGIKDQVSALASVQDNSEDSDTKQRSAMTQLALLVGAMTLARATRGDPLSDDFLAAAREALTEQTETS